MTTLAHVLRETCTPFRRVFTSFGATFEVRASSTEMLTAAESSLPPAALRSASAAGRIVFVLREPGSCACGRRDDDFTLQSNRIREAFPDRVAALSSFHDLVKAWIATNSPTRTFVHAGAVQLNGVGILIPGQSGSGKTELVQAFLRVGGVYYSDDFAVVTRTGMVEPYPVALGVRRRVDRGALGRPGPQTRIDAAAMGFAVGFASMRVSVLAFSEYVPGARWYVEELSSGQATMELLANCVGVRRHPRRSLAALGAVASSAIGFRCVRTDTDSVVNRVAELVDRLPGRHSTSYSNQETTL